MMKCSQSQHQWPVATGQGAAVPMACHSDTPLCVTASPRAHLLMDDDN